MEARACGQLLSQVPGGTEAGERAPQDESPPLALLLSTVGKGVCHERSRITAEEGHVAGNPEAREVFLLS